MKSLYIDTELTYDGTQLRSLYAYMEYGLLGDSLVSWIGPCCVDPVHMIDGEDIRAHSEICGSRMIHFILEKFDVQLATAVAYQRLMGCLTIDLLRQLSPKENMVKELKRCGDDIYLDDSKLNISIATQSPISSLVHFAINVTREGTPVKVLSLEDLEVSPREFADGFMKAVCVEVKSIQRATQKVKWVR